MVAFAKAARENIYFVTHISLYVFFCSRGSATFGGKLYCAEATSATKTYASTASICRGVARGHILHYIYLCCCTRVILLLRECSLCVSSCTLRVARMFLYQSSPRQWRCSMLLMQFLSKLLVLKVLPRRSSRFTFARVEHMIGSSW